MSFRDWVKRLFAGAPDDPIREGTLVRGLLSGKDYQASSNDTRAVFVVGAMDMFNQMIRYSSPAGRWKLAAMSDYANAISRSGALRDAFDQYLAADPKRAEIFAANAFFIFLSEEARKQVGR